MKKTRIIAVVLVVALMAMGAGYAAWNEQITINNNVTTGILRVEFIDNNCYNPYIYVCDNKPDTPDYLTCSISPGAKTTTVTVNGMYPGSAAVFALRADNLGSIPAKFDNAKVEFRDGASQLLKDNLLVYGQIHHRRPGQVIPVHIYNITTPFLNQPVTLSNLEVKLNDILTGLELKPDDYITFDITSEYKADLEAECGIDIPDDKNCIAFYLPMGVGNGLEDQSATFDITFNFKQFNK